MAKGSQRTVYLTQDLIEAIRAEAERDDRSFNAVVRMACEQYLAKEPVKRVRRLPKKRPQA